MDEELVVRNVLRDVLGKEGYRVDTAATGDEAWHLIQSMRYDCMLFDSNTRSVAVEVLYNRIRRYDERLCLRVIFTIAGVDQPESYAFVQSTGNQILNKPFDFQQLLHEIRLVVSAPG